jgi:23S rRNA pseudouridine2605 synthase
MRLAKHLAHAGIASRRASEELIFAGRVRIDGKIVTDPATDVDGSEAISVDDELLPKAPERRVVYVLNKPSGVLSTAKDDHGRETVVDLIIAPPGVRLYPVGRLDADSTGLILLTDDGDLAYSLTHPSFEVPKTYRVTVDGHVGQRALQALRDGVQLEDGMTAPAGVRQIRPSVIEITIHEGRKRQVKRMCQAVNHPVRSLQRIAFGPLRLGDLSPGQSRRLTPAEVQRLRDASPIASDQ